METTTHPTVERDDEPLVNAKHVGTALGLHHRTIELHAQSGRLPHYKIGAAIRFRMSEIWPVIKVTAK